VEKVKIFDATLCDSGQLPGVALTTEERLKTEGLLEETGVDAITMWRT
jgi:isopropylmalate/homocitrate/citramalate synthase